MWLVLCGWSCGCGWCSADLAGALHMWGMLCGCGCSSGDGLYFVDMAGSLPCVCVAVPLVDVASALVLCGCGWCSEDVAGALWM
eukprot:3443935-Karenia_brevis.AAC.1